MTLWLTMMVSYSIVQNFSLAAIEAWLIRRQTSWPKWIGWLPYLWAMLMVVLFVVEAVASLGTKTFLREWLYFPMSVNMVWNVLVVQALFPVMILVLLMTRMRHATGPAARTEIAWHALTPSLHLPAAVLGAAPATAIGMGVHGSMTADDLRVRKYDIALRNLPPELEGFTIAHVSDLHSGIFVGPMRLKIISDATNDLKADLIAITGDIVNREMNEFPARAGRDAADGSASWHFFYAREITTSSPASARSTRPATVMDCRCSTMPAARFRSATAGCPGRPPVGMLSPTWARGRMR